MDDSTARSRHPDSMRQAFLWALLPSLVLFLIAPSAVSLGQEVTTAITETTGTGALGTIAETVGLTTEITGGTRPGSGANLFHSFDLFTLGTGDTAHFLNDMQLPTNNIFARVIGGEVSTIDGTLRTNIPLDPGNPLNFGAANLWLVNPSGLLLGSNARVDVGGSVSFTTAQYLRLFDGVNNANFYANPANDGLANSVLFVAPVVDFGFLSPAAYGFLTAPDPSATITVQGSNLSISPALPDTPPNTISLVGGKVVIEGGAQLSAPNGGILLASTASPGEFAALPGQSLANATTFQAVPNNPEDPASAVSFSSFGTVSLAPGSSINVSGSNTVFVKGGQLVLSVNDATLNTSESPAQSDTISFSAGGSIATSNSGADPSADVQITVGTLQMDGAVVTTINSGDGNGGNISIDATTVGLTNGATILSSTGLDFTTFVNVGFGNGGNITANVGTLSITNGATINSVNFSSGLGQGGNVTVQGLEGPGSAADSVTLRNGTGPTISTITASDSGRGGDVHITADTFLIENASGVSSDTFLGSGVGGNLSLNVGTLTLKGGDFGGSSIRSTNSASGTDVDFDFVPDVFNAAGGDVTIQGINGAGSAADTVILSGGSRISSETLVGGDGGRVSLEATSLNMDEASAITSETFGIGRGGNIVVAVQIASLSGGATFASRTVLADPAAGAGGTIAVQGLDGTGSKADAFTLAGFRSGIISETFGSGPPGDVGVQAKTVSLTGGAVIEAGNPESTGTGGNVIIEAVSLEIVGTAGFPGSESHISSQASGLDAGKVTITADQLILDDNGSIATSTVQGTPGRGGDVELIVGNVNLSNRATINSSTAGTGRAGDITMNVGTLNLANGSISSASTGTAVVSEFDGTSQAAGTAGNVVITAEGSFTSDAGTLATSAEANHGGDVSITAQSVQLSNGTLITANSNAPLEVTKLVLDQDGQLVEQVVGDGNAGNITAHSNSTFEMNNSSMTTDASQASGGQIEIIAPSMVRLINSQVSTSVAGSDADTAGGNITIDPQFVILQSSQIRANAFAGSGGAIDIIAGVFLADPASVLSVSSTLGVSGTINIQSPLQNVGGRLTPLSQQFSSAAALLAQQCAARVADGKFSTFVVAGREGLPVEPGGFLASPSLTAELLGSSLSGRYSHTPIAPVTGSFPEYAARPILLAKYGKACHSVE